MRIPQVGERVNYYDFGFWGTTGPHHAIVTHVPGPEEYTQYTIDLEYSEGGIDRQADEIIHHRNQDGNVESGVWAFIDEKQPGFTL